MQVGDLVRWRRVIGIVTATRSSSSGHSSYVCWDDTDACWMNNAALEVLSEVAT